MFPPHLDYLKDDKIVWFNPCEGLFGFWREFDNFKKINNLNFLSAWSSREMKRAKEIYATSIAALATQQSEMSKRRWWIMKPPQDPPDGVIGTTEESPNGNLMNVREVEVVEHLRGNLLQTLDTKLARKSYEPNTILVCLISETGIYNFKKLSSEICKQNLSLQHIFLAAHGATLPANRKGLSKEDLTALVRKVSLIQLKPVFAMIELDPFITCSAWQKGEESSWLKFDGRGTEIGFKKVKSDNPPELF